MNCFRWISILGALFIGAGAQAQLGSPAEIDLFANDFPVPESNRGRIIVAGQSRAPTPATDHPHTLIFHNGRQLRGELAEVTKDEVLWRRREASELLRFARAEVRRIALVPIERLSNQSSISVSFSEKKAAPPPLATIKLPGSDWLRGAVTSADGETFALTLKGGAPLEVPRGQMEWLHFGDKPAPACRLGEGAMALEGWLAGGTPRVEAKDGTLFVHDAQWIGRALATPARFAIEFEVPAAAEEGLRLWIQPFNPQPNSYSTGTVQLTLGRESLKWLVFQDNTQPNNVPIPAEARAETGPVRYRVLYDALAQRLVLLRNGRALGDWSLKPKKEQRGRESQQRFPRGFCFDRQDRGQKTTMQFRQLRVLPWDGELTDAAEGSTEQDRLSTPTPPPLAGRLEAVREKELIFAGTTVPLAAETMVRFPGTPAPLAGAEAMLSFGEQGEISLAELVVSEGKVRGRAVFGPALELPAAVLQSIAFTPQGKTEPPAGDLLVFRNGDEISGALVAATTGSPLRWRLASGQELDFQTDRVAGVRLTSAAKIQPAGTIELRTGERLRGSVLAFDERELRWQHALLGEIAMDRAQIWRLFPNPKQTLREGGQDPESWLRETPVTQRFVQYNRMRPREEAWLALDGRFILRSGEARGQQALGPACELGGDMDCYELRVETASPGENSGAMNLNINFLSADEGCVAMNLSPHQMNFFVQNPKNTDGGANRELQFRDKIGDNVRQLSLRAFVNRPAGTIDFLINGHHVGRAGQSPGERLPGVGRSVAIDTYTYGRHQALLSEITITPWSGELPRFEPATPVTVLANGDVAAGLPQALREGRWKMESEIGPLDLAVDKVQAIEFGGEMQPAAAQGRLRLADGSALLVDRFEWKGGALSAHHAIFGDLRLPAGAVSELIFNPAPARPAAVADPKNLARKNAAAPIPIRQ